MHYGKVLDKVGGEHDGAWLMFKYATASQAAFNGGNTYSGTNIKTLFDSYFDQCSNELKSALQEFQIKSYDTLSSKYNTITIRLSPPSASQLLGTAAPEEGEGWDYMRVLTGITSGTSDASNSGRGFKDLLDDGVNCWTRTITEENRLWSVGWSGNMVQVRTGSPRNLLIAFALF